MDNRPLPARSSGRCTARLPRIGGIVLPLAVMFMLFCASPAPLHAQTPDDASTSSPASPPAAVMTTAEPDAPDITDNTTCLDCHDDFNVDRFNASAHAGMSCVDCHTAIASAEHDTPVAPVNCVDCHDTLTDFAQSVHGRARDAAPIARCASCHGNAHAIVPSDDPASPVHRSNIVATCAACHQDAEKMAPYTRLRDVPFTTYLNSVHGRAVMEQHSDTAAVCSDCHGAHNILPMTDPQSTINRANLPNTCGQCHDAELQDYFKGVHGKAYQDGVRDAPICTDCHGEHLILSADDPKSPVYVTSVSEKVCAGCHEAEPIVAKYDLPKDKVVTFRDSYHGLAGRFGVTKVANCASCHQAHKILPSSDPESSVHPSNLVQTCGQCHTNAGIRFTQGPMHSSDDPERNFGVFVTTMVYMVLIGLVIGGMILHNFLDFYRKFKLRRSEAKQTGETRRFTKNERIQHTVLMISFTVLAYSGFALKHPDAWWAAPFMWFPTGTDWRGLVHRVAAVIFSILTVYHLVYLFSTPRGRMQLQMLWPRRRDLQDAGRVMKYNLGLSKDRPPLGHYSYVEKMEYWALGWGSMIMMATGYLLTFENMTMHYLPKWLFDVFTAIHYYEAILATLAIVIWHLYFVMFDQEVYPLNFSMFVGDDAEKSAGGKSKDKNPA